MVLVSAAERSIMSKKYDVKLTWNFSTTSHGKGLSDEVRATMKRHAMKKVITRKCVINNAEEFYNACQK